MLDVDNKAGQYLGRITASIPNAITDSTVISYVEFQFLLSADWTVIRLAAILLHLRPERRLESATKRISELIRAEDVRAYSSVG